MAGHSGQGRPRRRVPDGAEAAPAGAAGWRALRQTLGVSAVSEYDRVLGVAREQLDRLGYTAPQPVSWRWGTLVVEAQAVDAARLRLDAARLCAAITAAVSGGGSGLADAHPPAVARLEVRVAR
jgi:hypothetical protein